MTPSVSVLSISGLSMEEPHKYTCKLILCCMNCFCTNSSMYALIAFLIYFSCNVYFFFIFYCFPLLPHCLKSLAWCFLRSAWLRQRFIPVQSFISLSSLIKSSHIYKTACLLIDIVHWVCLLVVSCHAGCCCVTYILRLEVFCSFSLCLVSPGRPRESVLLILRRSKNKIHVYHRELHELAVLLRFPEIHWELLSLCLLRLRLRLNESMIV